MLALHLLLLLLVDLVGIDRVVLLSFYGCQGEGRVEGKEERIKGNMAIDEGFSRSERASERAIPKCCNGDI